MDVYATFLQSIRRLGSPRAGDRIMVAVSGGPDSVALLHLLMALRQGDTPFAMAVAHLDHGVRGAAGAADAAFVADLARSLELPLLSGKLDADGNEDDEVPIIRPGESLPPHATRSSVSGPMRVLSSSPRADAEAGPTGGARQGRDAGSSRGVSRPGHASPSHGAGRPGEPTPPTDAERELPSEDRMRRARRAFFIRKASEWGANRIAVGHTRDDQAETILLNLLRGSGARGLGGIRPTTRLSAYKMALKVGDSVPIGSATGPLIIRPLLEIGRDDLADWLLARDLEWRVDHTNEDPRYLRNRVRLEVLPLLENLRPGARETLARSAALLRDDSDLLDRLARAEMNRLTLSIDESRKNSTATTAHALTPEEAITPFDRTLDLHGINGLDRSFARRVVRIAASEAVRAQGTSAGAAALEGSGPAPGGDLEDRAPLPARSASPAADRTTAIGAAWAPGARQVEAVLELAAAGKGGRVDLGRGHVAVLKEGLLTFLHAPAGDE